MGSRLARLNIKLITAPLLIDFDFETVDVGGRIVDSDSAPAPDWNDPLSQPVQGQFFVKYGRLDNPESESSSAKFGPCEVGSVAVLVQTVDNCHYQALLTPNHTI